MLLTTMPLLFVDNFQLQQLEDIISAGPDKNLKGAIIKRKNLEICDKNYAEQSDHDNPGFYEKLFWHKGNCLTIKNSIWTWEFF